MPSDLAQYAAEEIVDEEDDVGEFGSGAADEAFGWGKTTKDYAGYTSAGVQQATARLGNVAQGANLVQTGNLFSVASSGTSAALAPVVAVTGPIGIALALVDSALAAKSVYHTYKHIRNLEVILEKFGHLAKPGTKEAIVFCCKKKNKKLKRKGLSCVPILGSICVSFKTGYRSIKKRRNGTRGVERRQQASVLWQNTLIGDQCAIKACQELLGQKIYSKIEGLADGHLVLKKKLRSI